MFLKPENNKIIIVPDVHGRLFWRSVLANKSDRIVFLGDYSDPYERHEGFTHEDAIRELTDIIRFKADNPDRVTLLLGNHDVHYLHYKWSCSRFSKRYRLQYNELYEKNRALFQMALQININNIDYLFTHAGITREWVSIYSQNLVKGETMADTLNLTWEQNPNVFNTVGACRGGYTAGSPIWADVEEHRSIFYEFVQIFGHTQLERDPILSKYLNDLDCRRVFVLEAGEIKEFGQITQY